METIKGKRVALIGGAGFIGHNLALRLTELGAETAVVDSLQINNLIKFAAQNGCNNRRLYLNMLHQRLELLHKAYIPFFVQDARDYHALSRVLSEFEPHVVVHLAAVAHANKSNKDPYSTFDHSLRTLENALDWARQKAEHFIYLSSSMVYGHFPNGFVTEDTPCEPLGIYAALKFSGEKLVIAYNQVFDLPYTIIRPSALYGQRCVSRRVGQVFIEKAMTGEEITIHGDGRDRLDFTYIEDFLQGVIKVIGNENSRNQIFNLTYGESRSLSEMADIIREHFPDVKITYKPKDKLTPNRGTLSVDKAKRMLGYQPEYPLERGYVKYIEWYKKNKDLMSQ